MALAISTRELGSGTALPAMWMTPARSSVVRSIPVPEASDNEVPEEMKLIGTSPRVAVVERNDTTGELGTCPRPEVPGAHYPVHPPDSGRRTRSPETPCPAPVQAL